MRSTNGETITEYPKIADDLWSAVQPAQYKNIIGWRERAVDKDWLVWSVSTSGSTNNTSIVWDLMNQCWLQCTAGYKMNVVGLDDNSNPYVGAYDGFVYKPDQPGIYANASEGSPGTITAYWQSGWIAPDSIDKITQVRKLGVTYTPKASGNINVAYGYDGLANALNFNLAQTVAGAEVYGQKASILSGRGNTFEFKVSQTSSTINTEVESVLISGKSYGQKNQVED